MYEFLSEGQHMITVRNRNTGRAKRFRYWGQDTINNILSNQKDYEDVFVTKYPKNRLVQFLILDFDSKDDKELVNREVTRLRNQLKHQGHNSVVVDSTNKGLHLYIQIAPVLFKNNGNWLMSDWNTFFRNFQDYFLKRSKVCDKLTKYITKDPINSRAGLNGNIRLINSIHPVTGETVKIIDGSFNDFQPPTKWQDKSMRVAYQMLNIQEEREKYHNETLKTTVVDGTDPILNNDLREVIPAITGNPIKIFSRGYGYTLCFEHNDHSPSLLVTKDWFSCSSCGFKGNIWTLKKMGLVDFDLDGKVKI